MPGLIEMAKNMGGAVLLLLILLPVVSGKGTVVCSPLACIIVGGMFVAILLKTIDVHEELEFFSSSFDTPPYFSTCIDTE